MALIRHFERGEKNRYGPHAPIKAEYDVIHVDGETYFQFWTTGSDHRQQVGATSQTVRLDRTSAAELVVLLQNTFRL